MDELHIQFSNTTKMTEKKTGYEQKIRPEAVIKNNTIKFIAKNHTYDISKNIELRYLCKYPSINLLASLLLYHEMEKFIPEGDFTKAVRLISTAGYEFLVGFDVNVESKSGLVFSYHCKNGKDFLNMFKRLYVSQIIIDEYPSINRRLLCQHITTNNYLYTDFDEDMASLAKPSLFYNHKEYMRCLKKYTYYMEIDLEMYRYKIKIEIPNIPKVIWCIVSDYTDVNR